MVASRRPQFFTQLLRWATTDLPCRDEQVCGTGPILGACLMAFGKFLCYSGAPKYVFSETVNAVSDRFKHWRSFMTSAWSVLTHWEEEEPTERSMIMPEGVFKAALALSLAWQCPRFTAGLLLSFHGFPRPGEFLELSRRDLILPGDLFSTIPVAYVWILGKTPRFMKHQHAKISNIIAVRFLEATFGSLPPSAALFNCWGSVFRARWSAIFLHLGLPVS